MLKSEGVDYILCYLSNGLNEQIILSNYIIEYHNKNNIDNTQNKEFQKNLLNKIKILQVEFLKSEKFKKLKNLVIN